MKRKFGDRKDAKRVQIPSLMQMAVDLKPGRSDSAVYINEKIDVTELVSFMSERKAAGDTATFFHAFIAAIGKVIYSRPKMNRFVQNRHLYEHNDVSISFVAKMSLDDRSEEIMIYLTLDPEDTLDTIRDKVTAKVRNLRGENVDKKGANTAIDILGQLPNIIRVPILALIKWLDRKGLLPESLRKDNIYYSSMIISNLGSIHCGAIYHNITDFGSCSSLAAIGEIRDEVVACSDGTPEVRKLCEFGITLDERIADGFYFAKSCNLLKYILARPELLNEPVGKIVEME